MLRSSGSPASAPSRLQSSPDSGMRAIRGPPPAAGFRPFEPLCMGQTPEQPWEPLCAGQTKEQPWEPLCVSQIKEQPWEPLCVGQTKEQSWEPPMIQHGVMAWQANLFASDFAPDVQYHWDAWIGPTRAPCQPFYRRSTAAMPNVGPGRECKFCKNNGETMQLYRSHVLRNPVTNKLVCPVLREHVCEFCGATGDLAHTKNYCPLLKEKMREALPNALKRTRRQSDGQIRQ